MNRLAPVYRFGWAFLLAWVFCVFYTQVVEGYTGGASSVQNTQDLLIKLLFFGLPVLLSVLTLLVIVRLEATFGSPVDHPALFWFAPLATAVSCPLLFIQLDSYELTLLLFICGAVLTGVGSGCMWVMWGEYYAKISQNDVEFIAPISTAVAAVLVLLVSSMTGWVALFIVACFPLVSGFCLSLAWKSVGQQEATAEYSGETEQQAFEHIKSQAASTPWAALGTLGRSGFGILTACLFVCLLGSFWVAPLGEVILYQIVIVASILFTFIVALVSAKGPRRITVSFLLRWMCPVLVLGFVALIVWGQETGGYIAYLIAIAARFAFCLITQMYFAHFANSGKTTAVQAYGLGWVFVHLGDFIGVVCIVAFEYLRSAGLVNLNEIAALSIVPLTILAMFLIGSTKDSPYNATGGEVDPPMNVGFFDGGSLVGEGLGGNGPEPSGDAGETLVAATVAGSRAGLALDDASTSGSAANRPAVNSSAANATGTKSLASKTLSLAKSHGLTPRETEVFGLLARGRSVPFIRDALVISRDTAATHVKHVYAKLEVHSRQELIDLVQQD